jgi:hypothetical protein
MTRRFVHDRTNLQRRNANRGRLANGSPFAKPGRRTAPTPSPPPRHSAPAPATSTRSAALARTRPGSSRTRPNDERTHAVAAHARDARRRECAHRRQARYRLRGSFLQFLCASSPKGGWLARISSPPPCYCIGSRKVGAELRWANDFAAGAIESASSARLPREFISRVVAGGARAGRLAHLFPRPSGPSSPASTRADVPLLAAGRRPPSPAAGAPRGRAVQARCPSANVAPDPPSWVILPDSPPEARASLHGGHCLSKARHDLAPQEPEERGHLSADHAPRHALRRDLLSPHVTRRPPLGRQRARSTSRCTAG